MTDFLTGFDTDYNADTCSWCGGHRHVGPIGMCYYCRTGEPKSEERPAEWWAEQREGWAKLKVRRESFLAEYKAAKTDQDRRFVMLKFYPRETLRMERSPQPRRRFLQEG